MDLNRCAKSSSYYANENTHCSQDSTTIGDICRKTCRMCDKDDLPEPSTVQTESPITTCEDDDTCKIVRDNRIISICEWAEMYPSKRCKMKSKGLVDPESIPTSYDAKYVARICKKTCKLCFDVLEPTATPIKPSTQDCEDNHDCKLFFRGKVISICEWAAKNPAFRCKTESKGLVNPDDFKTSDDYTYVANICKKTCRICETPGKTIMPSQVPSTLPSEQPSSVCDDDPNCLILVNGEIMSVCEWAKINPNKRCSMKSKQLMNEEIIPSTYDATYVSSICQETCSLCVPVFSTTKNPSVPPSTLPSSKSSMQPSVKPSLLPSY
eukprot:CAMPEP_0194270490 /NCGR_PEP_ID=MMETSP0169-20130528/4463_1 /TAXON_ID=218684 /ORGANISM="Corethron pennatum, Strain L29A3" /LENGTH=323 /DNA_ID=CAMNT_0039012551 /DNA_START=372 /DNA_END=1340 /DNA_ORIENTATION=+